MSTIDHPLLPLIPGSMFSYEGETEDGTEVAEVLVTFDTKEILGVTCTVVEERVFLDGALVEETYDWYAQDDQGSVWYFGEDSRKIEDGVVVSTSESWIAGEAGAQPGLIMKANLRAGDSFRQEYSPGVAEEITIVLDVSVIESVAYGDLTNCVKTLEWDPITDDMQYKYYAPGIGAVLEARIDGSDRVELTALIR